jgi:CheY-like chemotaxis protein
LSEILAEQGYKVATAFSGEESVAQALSFLPDLLILDVCMGKMSGVKAATAIATLLPECKVLFLSGLASMSDVAKSAPKGLVYSFTPKPMHPLDLLNAIAYMVPARSMMYDSAAAGIDNFISYQT